ncbi:CU044_2847 family protein [Streptomyces phaeochromogenes]|uniref:CU044_2847 family protein n=1 Tax=Streptomyces phaeochromogenes TaxID=1923 RepID=UPI002E136638|nr:hypothetical protein OG437_16770 [Streptomyces phaeochromogenes]
MDGLVEFKTDDGAVIVVEGVEDESGSRLVARADGTVQAARTFEGSLEGVRAAAESALRVFRHGSLKPDTVEIEFGVKLTAEAGALIAKSAVEGHLVVKLSWSPSGSGASDGSGGSDGSPEPGPGSSSGSGLSSGSGSPEATPVS